LESNVISNRRIPRAGTAAISGAFSAVALLAAHSPQAVWAATAIGKVATPPTQATPATLSAIDLRAQPALGAGGKVEVRLRWTVKEGWLPDGGFNLYRSDRSTPLNPAPLGAGGAGAAPEQLDVGSAHPVALRSLITQATAVAAGTTLPKLSVTVTRPASASAAFDQAATQAQQLQAVTAPAFASTPITGAAPASGTVASPRVAPRPAALLPASAPTAAQVTAASRRTLLIGAAVQPAVASALGLTFDDTSVAAGQSYTYELRPIVNGAETTAVATLGLTVPTGTAGLKPAAPTGLRAYQVNADRVALRWDRLSLLAENAMGVASYDIYRATSGREPQKLNKIPVLVIDLADVDADGNPSNVHEAATFYTDTSPVIGRVSYLIRVTDVFGRTSDTASVALTVLDLHKPQPVTFAQAQLQAPAIPIFPASYRRVRPFHVAASTPAKQNVLVAWTPSADTGVNYQVYRVDAEAQGAHPSPLTASPIAGSTMSASSLPSGTIRDVLVAQTCLAKVRSGGTILNMAAAIAAYQSADAPTLLRNRKARPRPVGPCSLDLLTASARAQTEQSLLSGVQVLTYTDTTAQKDHYYRYYVAAVFTRNNEAATPIQTNVVTYPDFTPPAAPGNVTTNFRAAAASTSTASSSAAQTGTASPSGTNSSGSAGGQSSASISAQSAAAAAAAGGGTHVVGATAGSKAASAAKQAGPAFTLTDWKGPLVKAPPKDAGGTLVLTWSASPTAKSYEVYRANATQLTVPLHRGGTTTAGCVPGHATAMVNGHPVSVSMPAGVCVPAASLATVTWQKNPMADTDYVLLGTVTGTEYDDVISRSSAHYYDYRIVPINRWKVTGVMADVAARVPATMPPTPPKLLLGTAGADGGVQVEFVPDANAGEEVVTYQLWRSQISSGALKAAAAQQSSAAGSSAVSSPSTSGQSTTGGASKSAAAGAAAAANYTAQGGTYAKTATGVGSTASRFPVGPKATQLAGAAGRFGVQMHQPMLSAAVRAGTGIQDQLMASMLQGSKVADMTSTDAAAAAPASPWLADAPSANLSWQNDYAYWVRAVDKDGLQSDSEPVDVTPLKVSASAPGGLTATWNSTQCRIDVAWQATDPETKGFIIERELSSAGASSGSTGSAVSSGGQINPAGIKSVMTAGMFADNYIQIAPITAATPTQYSDYSAFPDNAYLYRVRTLDAAGNLSTATELSTSVSVPDGCGNTATKRVLKRAAPAATAPASTDASPASGTKSGSASATSGTQSNGPAAAAAGTQASGTTGSSGSPSSTQNSGANDPSNAGGTPNDADSDTPVTSPPAPTVAKPADEIDIPATRPPQ
jgi:hypothetical protein